MIYEKSFILCSFWFQDKGQREDRQFAIPLFDEDEKPEEDLAADGNGEEKDSATAEPEAEPEGKHFHTGII